MKKFMVFITMIWTRILYNLQVYGLEHVKKDEPYLLCANHTSLLDMFFIQVRLHRWIHWMAKVELYESKVIAWFLRHMEAFPVHRGKPDIGALKKAIYYLKKGNICGVFPEGTRKNQNKGIELSPKSGAAFLAYKAAAKIIPVYVSEDHRPFHRVRVVFGEPFSIVKDRDGHLNAVSLQESSQKIMDRIYALKEVHG